MSDSKLPTREQIERRAYDLYLERGGEDGHDLRDWFAAEKELTEMSEQPTSTARKAFAKSAGTNTGKEATGDGIRKPEARITKRSPEN
jgi:hypothetical protein